ncbi:MAG: hypothetical protein AB8I08_37890 [Sandaracinaceae bacterium]
MSDFGTFPNGHALSPEQIERRFVRTEVRPPANPEFAFRALLPRDWIEDAVQARPVDAQQLTPLAAWHVDKEGTPVVFHVQAIQLLRAVTAADFNRGHGVRHRMPLEAMREVSPYLCEALFLREIEGQPFSVRMATALIGDRAYVASGIAHARDCDAHNEDFGVTMASLEVLERPASPFVEPRVRRTLLQRVEFDTPRSFRSMSVPGTTRTHEVRDLVQRSPEGETTGLIRVDCDLEAVGRSVDEELAYVAAHLQHRGVQLSESTQELALVPGEGPLQVTKSLKVNAKSGDALQSVWITLAQVRGAALRLWMLSPSRESHFHEWSVNQRGYRILLETLKVLA